MNVKVSLLNELVPPCGPSVHARCDAQAFGALRQPSRGRHCGVLVRHPVQLADGKLLITSSHGLQFLVPDRFALDRHSRKLLERFL